MRANLARAAEGARMPLAVELDDVAFAYRPGQPCSATSTSRVEPGEFVAIAGPERRRQDDAAPARARARAADARRRRASSASPPTASRDRAAHRLPRAARAARRRGAGDRARGRLRRPRAAARPVGRFGASDRARVDEAIERVGLAELAGTPAATPLRRPAAAGVHRQGARRRAEAARARRADRPASTSTSQESLAALLDELHRELGVTILYVSHEFGAVEHVRRAARARPRRHRLRRRRRPRCPAVWHDPSHAHA